MISAGYSNIPICANIYPGPDPRLPYQAGFSLLIFNFLNIFGSLLGDHFNPTLVPSGNRLVGKFKTKFSGGKIRIQSGLTRVHDFHFNLVQPIDPNFNYGSGTMECPFPNPYHRDKDLVGKSQDSLGRSQLRYGWGRCIAIEPVNPDLQGF